MKKCLLLILAILMILSIATHGNCGLEEDYRELLIEYQDMEKTDQSLDREKTSLTNTDLGIKEAIKNYQRDMDELKDDINTLNDEWRVGSEDQKAVHARGLELQAIVDRHNANKPTNRNSPNYNAEVRAWNEENRRIKQMIDAFEERRQRMRDRTEVILQHRDQIEARKVEQARIAKDIQNQREKLNQFVVSWAARKRELDARRAKYNDRLEQYNQKFANCKQLLSDPNTKDEALRLGCGNVQFDGANPNLPPLKMPFNSK